MSHRRAPLYPKDPLKCRWCGEDKPLRLKQDGTPRKVQSEFHTGWPDQPGDCKGEWLIACNASWNLSALKKRDGWKCACCGNDYIALHLDVDHVIPLWKVKGLPIEIRRKYYLLGNLQLLCSPCHKRKSAKEAAERAHFNRLAKTKDGNAKPKRHKLQSRGFDKRYRKRMNGEVVER